MERRKSTGGAPPYRVTEHYVLEQVPSHDDTPCFTAWVRQEMASELPPPWTVEDCNFWRTRPDWSIQIYDTTPGSADPEHLKAVAEIIHEQTREERFGVGRDRPDRIDVWGLPLAAGASDEERAARCRAHMMAEFAAWEKPGRPGVHAAPPGQRFGITILRQHTRWDRGLVVIARPRDLWNEGKEGFLTVEWAGSADPDVGTFPFTHNESAEELGFFTPRNFKAYWVEFRRRHDVECGSYIRLEKQNKPH